MTTPIAVNIESTNGLLDDCNQSNIMHSNHFYATRSQQQQQQHQQHHHHHHHQQYLNSIAAISAGSSNKNSNVMINMNSISSANTTQTSLTTNPNQLNINENIVDFGEFNEEEELNEEDFILYTSNNLEFLKSHSLFNGKSPLNYYPSLTNRSLSKFSISNIFIQFNYILF